MVMITKEGYDIVCQLLRRGVRLTVKDGNKLVTTPGSLVPEELGTLIREHKPEIVTYLEIYRQKYKSELPVYPEHPCYCCHSKDFWLRNNGAGKAEWICAICHPDPNTL